MALKGILKQSALNIFPPSGDLSMGGFKLTDLGTPTASADAATKAYVDAFVSGLTPLTACVVKTTAALTATYSNGAAGVGATLTNSGAMAAIVIDGVTLSLNQRVLVNNQAAAAQNGIYTVTTAGSGAVNWVLTRATDFDTAAEMLEGSYTNITSGTANQGTLWIFTTSAPITVGTTALNFGEFGVFGTMSTQNASAVTITGGTINGAIIGGSIPAAGTFTTVVGTSFNALRLSSPSVDSDSASVSIGTQAMNNFPASAAYHNTAVGYQAMQGAVGGGSVTTAAAGNAAFGYQALQYITTGDSNMAFGPFALSGLQAGAGNIGVGYAALGNAVIPSMSNSTAIGYFAGANVTGASNNTIIGASVASVTLATGTGNIFIGCSNAIDATTASTSNTLKIGNSATPVISATGINGTPTITMGGATTASALNTSADNLWTKQQNFTQATLTSTSNSIAWNLSTGQTATHTATESTTLANPTNMVAGGNYQFTWVQNASVAKTLAFGGNFIFQGGVTPTVSATLSSVAIFSFISDGSKMRCTGYAQFLS